MKTDTNSPAPEDWLRRLVLLWLFPWRESKLITADKQIYTVRDAPMREREIRNPRSGKWTPESKVRFSLLECFEDYHRDAYFAATREGGANE